MRHLFGIAATAAVGFGAAFVFADRLLLPRDLYYLLYFVSVMGFAWSYARRTRLDVRAWLARRLGPAVVLGVVVGAILTRGVLARPATTPLAGGLFWWAVAWRGVAYGLVDGVLMFALPWTIVWRAFDAEHGRARRRIAAGGAAFAAVLFVTTAYHLGYRDFRTGKIVQPNIGNAIASAATLAAASPIASPVAHVFLHVTAVIHSPDTDLFLPPHRP
jgi:hypothetical protein